MSMEAFADRSQNLQRLARLKRIQRAIESRERSNAKQTSPSIRMIVSPWYNDELGIRTRQIRAAS
jgi:hypothetical protein